MKATRPLESMSSLHSMPGSQVLQLVELARALRVDTRQLLDGTGLCEADLEAPDARVPLALVAVW